MAQPAPRSGRWTPCLTSWRCTSATSTSRTRTRHRRPPPPHAGRLAHRPALRNLAHEGVRGGVARQVPARGEQAVDRGRHETAERDGHVRIAGIGRRRDADLVVVDRTPVVQASRDMRVDADEPPAVAGADLRRRVDEPGALEARHLAAVEVEHLPDAAAPLDLDGRQVLDVETAIPRHLGRHEQRDVVARHGVGPIDDALFPSAHHDRRVPRRLVAAEGEVALHVDAAPAGGQRHPVVDVRRHDELVLLARVGGQRVRVVRRAGQREDVAVARGVDRPRWPGWPGGPTCSRRRRRGPRPPPAPRPPPRRAAAATRRAPARGRGRPS